LAKRKTANCAATSSLLRETAGGLFTRAPEKPDGILCHTDETGLARLIGEADTVLRF